MNTENSPWGILTGIRPVKIATALIDQGKTDKEIIAHFTEHYHTTNEKATLALETARVELPHREKMLDNGISLYIGIPFCPTRCLYCSFVTCGTQSAAKLIPEYVECLKKEIIYTAKLIEKHHKRIETIYFGGGTPTTLSAEQLHILISTIEENCDLSSLREFTVEAGRPDTVTEEKLRTLKAHKVERISINPQTMHHKTLKIIGRSHTPEQIVDAVRLARFCGFDNINMDLIAGLPGEDFDMFRTSLEEVEKLNPEDTTIHTMSIKRSSRLNEYLDEYDLTKGETVAQMVDYARTYLEGLGKHPYYLYRQKNILGNLENIGYAKNGKECLYNIYIMEEIQSILALGCGGSTKTVDRVSGRIERIFNVKEPQDYIARIDEMLERKNALNTLVF